MSSSAVHRAGSIKTIRQTGRNVNTVLQYSTHLYTYHTHHLCLVCFGGVVEGNSVEWGPFLAFVSLLEGDTHHRGLRGEEGR